MRQKQFHFLQREINQFLVRKSLSEINTDYQMLSARTRIRP